LIRKNHKDKELVDGLNKQRYAFIKEIREVEAYNLKAISDLMNVNQSGEELTDEDLFPSFCFFIKLGTRAIKKGKDDFEYSIRLRLIVTDKYLSRDQVRCFENIFNSSKWSMGEKNSYSFSLLFNKMKGKIYCVTKIFNFFLPLTCNNKTNSQTNSA
jgi:hypothetical protein